MMNRADNCSRYLVSILTGIPEIYIPQELYETVTSLVAGYLLSIGVEVCVPIIKLEELE